MPSTATSILDGLSTSVAVKAPVYAVTSASITLSGWQVIGGVDLEDLSDQGVTPRVLVKDQTNAEDNGIYIASSSAWQRAKDFDGNRDVVQGTLVLVRNDTVSGALYEVTSPNPIVVGTSDIEFTLRAGPNVRYDQTQAEIDAGVTPLDLGYAPGHVFRQGAVGDDSTDNTTAIQDVLDAAAGSVEVYFPKGTYRAGKLTIPSNTRIRLEPGTIIRDTGGLGVNDRFLNINSVSNVHIIGWGAKVLSEGYVSGEQRHGVFVWKSQRVRVEGLEVTASGGDGFYVGGDAEIGEDDWPEDVHIVGCTSDSARRNGVSVTQGRNIYFIGHRSSNTSGTSPQKGYDVEANESDDTPGTIRGVLQNVHFLDCTSEDNTGAGFSFAGANDTANEPITVFFESCHDNGSGANFQTENSINNPGLISWKNCIGINANTSGYEHKSCGMKTHIDGMYIVDANQNGLTAERNASSFSVYSANGTDGTTYGRLTARNCYALGSDAVKAVSIDLVSEATSVIRDVDIEVWSDRIATKGCFYGVSAANLAGVVRVKFTDETEFASTTNLGTSAMPDYVNELLTNEGASGTVTHSIDDPITRLPGVHIKARCKETQLFSLNPGSGWTIGGRSVLRTRRAGAEVTVESDGVSNWRIVQGGDGWFGDEINFAANDATPSVAEGTVFRTANNSATTITAFDDPTHGKEIIVFIGDANTTIDFTGTTLKGNALADWTPSQGDFMRCIYDGTNWRCSVHDCT